MAEYIEVNGRQIRVRPTETVSEVSSVLPHWKSTGENITGHLESRQQSSF